jgi:IgGFc binding protein
MTPLSISSLIPLNSALRRVFRCAGILFLALVSHLLSPAALAAQDSKGTDFWLMFGANGGSRSSVELILYITGDNASTGSVSIPGLGFSVPFVVAPGQLTTIALPIEVEVLAGDVVTNRGIHVVANAEVSVYGLSRRPFSTEFFLGLPTDTLGKEYISLGYANFGVNGTQMGIVGTQAGTVVTITPSTAAGGARAAGVPYTIELNPGQAYQLRSSGAPPADLTGTVITATAPIAVYGGHLCANIPAGENGCNHIVEQLPPTSTWGKYFVTLPMATRILGDTIRILASTNDTAVMLNGVNVATLNRGQFYERLITAPSVISSSQPVVIAQYSNSSSFDGTPSDPFEMLIPPYSQFLNAYAVTTPVRGFDTNFINVVVPNGAVGSTKLDGVVIPAASFALIPGSGFSGAQLRVGRGAHNLTGPLPFGVYVYGFAEFDAYGYPGGMSLSNVGLVTSMTLSPSTALAPVGTLSCFDATVLDRFSQAAAGIRVDFAVTGVNPRTGFVVSNAAGKAQYCYTGTNLGVDTVIASVDVDPNLTKSSTMTWTAKAACLVDDDSDIDSNDLGLIRGAIGQNATVNDPRDANRDGKILINDVRACTARCTRPGCATGDAL